MEKFSQQLPTILTQPTQQATINPPNSTQTTGGCGNQPTNEVAAATKEVEPILTSSLSKNGRKRKPNASGPRKTSIAWDHFIKIPESESKDPTAACKYCNKKYLCDTKVHGTSNLLAHLKTCPKYTYAISQDPKQTVLIFNKSGEETDLGVASHRFNVEACRLALAMFIILDEQPFRVVEGEGFKYLCRVFQPQFTVPSRQTITRDCFQLYLDEKIRLKSLFRSSCKRVALTTDCWTSVQNLCYLTLTAHFIDNDWSYQKRIISFSIVPNHRGETIGKQIEVVLREWGLRNVSTITVDNASSNDVAVAYLRGRLRNMSELVLDGQFFHMRCCAHILNLVVNDGLRDLHNSIASIRNAIRFVRSSPHRLAKFKECIVFARISCSKLVCLDVPTRWNSTYLMLDAAEKFQTAFEMLGGEEPSYLDYFSGIAGPPTMMDWENARAFVGFLRIFYESTKVLSSSLHVSIHSAFHQLALVYCEIKKSILNANSVLSDMGREMKKKYDKYWGNLMNINQLIYFGVILDPRYKLKYVQWSFEDMYNDDPIFLNKLSTSVRNNLSKMYAWYATTHEQGMRGQSSLGSLGGNLHGETSVPSEMPTHLARTDAFKQHLRAKNSIDRKNELERYLAEECVDEDDKFELLVWWKQNSSRFPILSCMVRDVMATPVSTVASESAFSTRGRVLDAFRSSLTPEVTEALICAQNWLKPSINQHKDLNFSEELKISEKIISEFRRKLQVLDEAGETTGADVTARRSSQSAPMHIG